MVNMNKDTHGDEVEITNEAQPDIEETELVDLEEKSEHKLKALRDKLAKCDEEKRQLLEDSQRARADFLNAKRRLEEERARDKVRHQKQHVLELLPLCDSFQMAMADTEVWEKADKAWRTGMEGIHTQLMSLLEKYHVKPLDPKGETFDPHKHEAVGMETVDDESLKDKVVSVVQKGYEIRHGDTTEVVRPARVTTGIIKE